MFLSPRLKRRRSIGAFNDDDPAQQDRPFLTEISQIVGESKVLYSVTRTISRSGASRD